MPKIAPDAPTVTAFGFAIRAPGGAREAGDEVEQEVPHGSEPVLERPADPPERQHVHAEVDRAVVEERRGEQAPPLTLGEADELAVGADALTTRAQCSKIQPELALTDAPPASWSR